MIRIIGFLCLVAAASVFGDDKPWNTDLKVRFGINPFNSEYFAALPRNSQIAEEEGWVLIEGPPRPLGYASLTLWVIEKDYCVGILCDKNGQTVGVQITIRSDKLELCYDPIEQGFIQWNTSIGEETDESYYYSTIYFATESSLDTLTYDIDTLIRDKLVVQGTNGNLLEIPPKPENLDPIWKVQACVPFMGLHYYYNTTTSMSCEAPLYPYFPLYHHGQIVGVGFMFAGQYLTKGGKDCFEHPTVQNVKDIVPYAHQCMYDVVAACHATTLHIYFIDTPRLIFTC